LSTCGQFEIFKWSIENGAPWDKHDIILSGVNIIRKDHKK